MTLIASSSEIPPGVPALPDELLAEVGQLVLLGQSDSAEARRRLLELWRQVDGSDGDPLHRCAVAHALADVQDGTAEELRWDLAALEAATAVSDERLAASGAAGSAAALHPSLHLNIADCYRRLGDADQARQHLDAGLCAVTALPGDGYGRMITAALERLRDRLHG